MQTIAVNTEKNMQGISLILAPLVLSTSIFFWQNGEYTVAAATLLIISLFFWIPALTGLFGLTKNKMPRYAVYGLWVAVFGCISGVFLRFLGYLTSIFNIDHQAYLGVLSHYPVSSQILLFASGPLFPISIIVLGIILIKARSVAIWQGILLSLTGLAFPLSRILRIESVAHIVDLLFLVPCIFISTHFFRQIS